MSTKNGWLSVLSTSATVGFVDALSGAPRLQDSASAATPAAINSRFIVFLRSRWILARSELHHGDTESRRRTEQHAVVRRVGRRQPADLRWPIGSRERTPT